MKVLRVDDFGVAAAPPETAPIKSATVRTDLKPLEITQPQGPSFTVEGHLVRWQNWQIRVGFHVRDGLIFHQIGYEDKGRLRPIMHRASMAEMVVPYGDPTGGNYRRNAFDTGEYGVGQFLDSLTLGCDCLATSSISTPGTMTGRAIRRRSRTPSACTRKISARCGSSPTG